MGLVLFLLLVGKVKDNLKLSVWDEPMQKSFVVVGVLTVAETGYVLEVFNAVGESIDVIVVPMSAVQPLRNDEILTVRSLAKAS